MTEIEKVTKIEGIDFAGLNEKVKEHLGVEINLKATAEHDYANRWYAEVQNTAPLDAGLMGKVLKVFGIAGEGRICSDNENVFGLILHFTYQHVNGGSNGMEIGMARYYFQTGEWKYEPVKEL